MKVYQFTMFNNKVISLGEMMLDNEIETCIESSHGAYTYGKVVANTKLEATVILWNMFKYKMSAHSSLTEENVTCSSR